MRRKSALEALEAINAKVHACTENEVRPEVIECLENAARKLFVAVQGDAYLRNQNYAVLEIPASHLNDPDSLADFLYQLARKLVARSTAEEIRANRQWLP